MITDTTIEFFGFDYNIEIEFEISGQYYAQTMTDPEEFPELEIVRIDVVEFDIDIFDSTQFKTYDDFLYNFGELIERMLSLMSIVSDPNRNFQELEAHCWEHYHDECMEYAMDLDDESINIH